MKIHSLLLLLSALSLMSAQQICLKAECATEIAQCDSACVALMGKCTFDCTLSSVGCLQRCIGDNSPAIKLLECSFNKCINL